MSEVDYILNIKGVRLPTCQNMLDEFQSGDLHVFSKRTGESFTEVTQQIILELQQHIRILKKMRVS
jgi:hypothetical protein